MVLLLNGQRSGLFIPAKLALFAAHSKSLVKFIGEPLRRFCRLVCIALKIIRA